MHSTDVQGEIQQPALRSQPSPLTATGQNLLHSTNLSEKRSRPESLTLHPVPHTRSTISDGTWVNLSSPISHSDTSWIRSMSASPRIKSYPSAVGQLGDLPPSTSGRRVESLNTQSCPEAHIKVKFQYFTKLDRK